MAFILGFMMGLLTAIGLLAYWLCRRPGYVARLISGIAKVLGPPPNLPAGGAVVGQPGKPVDGTTEGQNYTP